MKSRAESIIGPAEQKVLGAYLEVRCLISGITLIIQLTVELKMLPSRSRQSRLPRQTSRSFLRRLPRLQADLEGIAEHPWEAPFLASLAGPLNAFCIPHFWYLLAYQMWRRYANWSVSDVVDFYKWGILPDEELEVFTRMLQPDSDLGDLEADSDSDL